MPNLKNLRNRKKSILATRKITSAMKMIAAAKLKKAYDALEKARPYGRFLSEMLKDLLASGEGVSDTYPLLHGRKEEKAHLLVVATSNRGLCGGFNAAVVRSTKRFIQEETAKGISIQLLCWGIKGRDQLRREFEPYIIDTIPAMDNPRFKDIAKLSQKIQVWFQQGCFDKASIIYNHFISALSQEVVVRPLIPFSAPEKGIVLVPPAPSSLKEGESLYEYEPSKPKVLEALLPKNLSVQIFTAILESLASEQGARMTAMDAATRNAEEMTQKLDLQYNRTRQALITKQLIEIISGAEAL